MKFPDPKAQTSGNLVFCESSKVVKLYNAAGHPGRPEKAKTLGSKAQQWFISKATELLWSGVKFMKAYGTAKSAGCVMWVEPPVPPSPPPKASPDKPRRSCVIIFADVSEDIDSDNE